MVVVFAFSVLTILSILAFQNWKKGFALAIVMALLQDPLRKLVEDQPVYFVVLVGGVFAAAVIGALVVGVKLSPNSLGGWRKHLGLPFAFVLSLIAIQAAHSLARYGNPVLTSIGLMSYLAPIPAVALAFRFELARSDAGVLRWMRFYVIAATLALATVYLEYAGVASDVLGEVGGGVLIFGGDGYYKGNSGIFRAAEIAAWHAATVACFAFILFRGRRYGPIQMLLIALFIAFLIGIGVLTGRRKMLIEVAIFLCTYFALSIWLRRRNAKAAVLMALLGLSAFFGGLGFFTVEDSKHVQATEDSTAFQKYSDRARTVFDDLPKRVYDLGMKPVTWAFNREGLLGGGVGVGSQGAQHFGGDSLGAAEGGMGKITVELGIPGLVLSLWFLAALVRFTWHTLHAAVAQSEARGHLAIGLTAFIVANAAAFSVATQAYGDLFILLTLGWSFGFLIAIPYLADEHAPAKPNPVRARHPIPVGGRELLEARARFVRPNRIVP